MNKFFYNSWIANHLLFEGYSTITVAAFVFTKHSEESMPQRTKNHECTHIRQWYECLFTSGTVIWLLMLIFGISELWLLLAFVLFYILYVLEWLVKLPKYKTKAYRNVSFEREARIAGEDNNYLENSKYFAWVKLI